MGDYWSYQASEAGNNQSEVATYRRAGKGQKAYEVRSFCCLKKVPYESSGIISAQTWLLKSVCGNASATFLGSPYIFLDSGWGVSCCFRSWHTASK